MWKTHIFFVMWKQYQNHQNVITTTGTRNHIKHRSTKNHSNGNKYGND